jgi:putative flavoprotein involved in K+ transport
VRLAVRTPPNIVRRQVGVTPNQVMAVMLRRLPPRLVDSIVRVAQRITIGDLTKYGLPKPERGVYTRVIEDDVIPIIDVGLIDAVKDGQVEIVEALLGFDGPDVILGGHERIRPDAVIVATGYRRGLEPLVGDLGVLGANGKPLVNGAHTHPDAPGLYFTGFTNPISGMFRELKIDARRIARAIEREQGPRAAARPPAAAGANAG